MSVLNGPGEARAALHRIAALMQCEPDDDDDLTEAVRLLVSERNEALAEIRRLWDANESGGVLRVIFRGGYVEDESGDRWWSAGLLSKVEQERDAARAEVERMRERTATQEDGLRHGEQVCARLVTERDKLRAERRQLRARLVECLPFVGVCPTEPSRVQWMRLVRDLADEALEEVQP